MTQEQEQLIHELKLAIQSNNQAAVTEILAKSDFEFVKDESFELGSFIIDIACKKIVFDMQSRANIFLAVLTKIPQLITRGAAGSENCLLTKIAKSGDADLLYLAIDFLKKKYLQRYNMFFAENNTNSKLNFSILFQNAAIKSHETILNRLLNEAPHFKEDISFIENLKSISMPLKASSIMSPLSQPVPLSQSRFSAFTPIKQNNSGDSAQNSSQRSLNFLSPISTSTISSSSTHSPSASFTPTLSVPFVPLSQVFAELPQPVLVQNPQLNAAYNNEIQQRVLFQNAYQYSQAEIAQLREENRALVQRQGTLENQCQQMRSQCDQLQQTGRAILQKYEGKKKELEEATHENLMMKDLNQRLSAEASKKAQEQAQEKLSTTVDQTISDTKVLLLEINNNTLQRQNNQLLEKNAYLDKQLNQSLTDQLNMYKMINKELIHRSATLASKPKISAATIEVISDSEESSEQSSKPILHQYVQVNHSIQDGPSNHEMKRKNQDGDKISNPEIESSDDTHNPKNITKKRKLKN